MLRVKLIRELLADDGRIECVDVPVAGDVGGARGPLKCDTSEFIYSDEQFSLSEVARNSLSGTEGATMRESPTP